MAEYVDLGLVNDKIVSVTRTSGTGQPGTVDTWTMTLISGRTFNFTVTNGSAVDGSPSGVYNTLAALEEAHPSGDGHIYVVLADGKWYYWDTTNSAWTAGGQYLSTGGAVPTSRTIAGISLASNISAQDLTNALMLATNEEIEAMF